VKTLVLDPTLAGPLGLVTEVALLKVLLGTVTMLIASFTSLLASWRGQDVLA
jgi:hypothetical protein